MALSAWQVNILGFKKVWLVLNSKTQVWFFAVLCPLGRFCTVGRIFLCHGGKISRSFTSDYGGITNEHNRIAVDALVLSADAFAVSMCKGLSEKKLSSNTIYPSGCGSEVFRR